MFQQSILSSEESRRPWTFSVSLLAQALFIAIAVLIPLLAQPALPVLNAAIFSLQPPPPPRTAPPPPPDRQVAVVRPEVFSSALLQPRQMPPHAAPLVDVPPPTDLQVVGVPYVGPGAEGGVITGIVGPPVKPPPPPAAEPEPIAAPIRVSSTIQAAKIIKRVLPAYPEIARRIGASGVVRLQAVIAADGTIAELNVISGHPLLVKAATDAVSQWRYRPTVLGGKPVAVNTQIEVNFTLGR